MIEDKKRKGLAALIIDAEPSPTEDSSMEESEDSDSEMIAEEILSAIKKSDKVALAESLYSFFETCKYKESKEDDEE